MKMSIHRIGNSQGVILPKPLLAQVGLTHGEVEVTIEHDAIVLRKPEVTVRAGWAEAARKLADAKADGLVWPEFSNEADENLTW
ncbi:MAG: AbrB/MazE/SpoVT family DNA-binding domain-containing protein [Candidatus Eremiobacteraeota bacterium]|nr:AbrB/MazE/SpoVT family DNA-binding domain-containing protein [Candidatus Eremiobacteraeota bacterium]